MRLATAMLVLAFSAAAHAEAPRLSALFDLPRSSVLAPEPLAKPWQTQAKVDLDRFDIFFSYALISYAGSSQIDRWHPFFRIGPGLYMRRTGKLNYLYLGYEISRFSKTTVGLWWHTLDMRNSWGAGVNFTLDHFGRPGVGFALCWMNACLETAVRDTEDHGPTLMVSASATGWIMWLYDALRKKREND